MTYEDWTRLTGMSLLWLAVIGLIVWSAVKLARLPAQPQPAPRPVGRPRCTPVDVRRFPSADSRVRARNTDRERLAARR